MSDNQNQNQEHIKKLKPETIDRMSTEVSASEITDAVNNLENIQDILAYGYYMTPPEISKKLTKLQEAMEKILNNDCQHGAMELLGLINSIEAGVSSIRESAENICKTMSMVSEIIYATEDSSE